MLAGYVVAQFTRNSGSLSVAVALNPGHAAYLLGAFLFKGMEMMGMPVLSGVEWAARPELG